MKFEILAKRIAEKAQCPELEDALLGRGDFPHDNCMIWTGRKNKGGIRQKLVRDGDMRPEIIPVMQKPTALIQYQGKTHYVPRLLHELLISPLGDSRLKNLCGNSLCVNPYHWGEQLKSQTETEDPPEPVMTDDWSFEELEEWAEDFFETNDTITQEDIDLLEIPEDLLTEVLTKIGKTNGLA